MDGLWILLAFWIGTCAGFLIFALMAMARDGDRHQSVARARFGSQHSLT